MSKGTVLYIGGFELPDKNAAAQRVIANGKLLRDLGYDVIFDGLEKSDKQNLPSFQSNNYFGFECYAQTYPAGGKNWLKYITMVERYKTLVNKHSKTKAIICYNLPAISLNRLKQYCTKKNILVISDCTEWYQAPKEGNLLRKYAKKWDIVLRMNIVNPKLDGIICISEFLYNHYKQRIKNSVKIPPLVDLQDSKWNRSEKEEIKTGPIKLLYAGSPFSFVDKSNIKDRLDLIVQALAFIKGKQDIDFTFDIVGITKVQFLEFFPDLQKDVNTLSNGLTFHGRVPHDTALRLLKLSDYSIFLRNESIDTLAGFPTKFVESISCGVPVLTNKSSNLEDYLEAGINGFWIDINNLESIVKCLSSALSIGRTPVQTMKRNCLTSNHFDYRNFYSVFEGLLNFKVK